MRKVRAVLAGAVTVGVLGAMGAPGPALAATNGVGTADASTSLIKVSLGSNGSVLGVRVLGEDSQSNTDPAVAKPAAAGTRLLPLSVTSSVVPALNATIGAVESRSSGPQTVESSPVIDLGTAATSGSVSPFSIVSQVDSGVARSQLDTSAAGLTVAGGLLSVPSAVSALDTSSGAERAQGVRGVKVPSVVVLDLSALLDGLGIDLVDLPIGTLTGLLTTLDLSVEGVGSGAAVLDAVEDLNATIDELQELLDTGGATVDDVLDVLDPVSGLIDLTPIENVGSDATAALNAAIDEAQASLGDLLTDVLQTLDNAALLKVTDIDVGLSSNATGTVEGSSAAVSAKLGGISVGNVALPGVDAGAALAQVNATIQSIESKVGGVLDDVHPGLANLVDVGLFDKSTTVTADGKYVTAAAALTALVVKVVPPADLTALVGQVVAGTGVDELLADLGLVSAASAGDGVRAAGVLDGVTPMGTLGDTLGVDALAGGAELRVLDFRTTSRFAPTAGTTPAPPGAPAGELPRTGGDMPLAALGLSLLAAALVLVRWLRTPSTVR